MKLYVEKDYVYFLKDQILHKTQTNCYGFCDLSAGTVVVEKNPEQQDQMLRIRDLLMPVQKVA